jgi:hypothetical protein
MVIGTPLAAKHLDEHHRRRNAAEVHGRAGQSSSTA